MLLFAYLAAFYSAVYFLCCSRRDWLALTAGMAVLLAVVGIAGCAGTRELPPLVRPLDIDSLERVAQLPAYLVPAPAHATPRQQADWFEAQTKALSNVGAPVGKIKMKNVGNVKDKSRQKSKTATGGTPGWVYAVAGLLVLAIIVLVLLTRLFRG
ncbi:hypothetical protein LJY25_08115 [Hymenobacter sp. BT175]|uniref:hypothetical protein n=1 Tax=Hymenobacter translucens TaxID=2886507 RepID=UPI001D0E4AD9|nr:hypothetical protein [Hymenobacter translucens]MCC2546406.1 hypothetical protein [Hymenobacter translucens]